MATCENLLSKKRKCLASAGGVCGGGLATYAEAPLRKSLFSSRSPFRILQGILRVLKESKKNSSRILQNSYEFLRILKNSLKNSRIPKNFLRFRKIPFRIP